MTECLLLTSWADDVSKRDSRLMTDYYSDNAVLLATFENLLKGPVGIKKYFDSFLAKDRLVCEIIENYFLVNEASVQVCSGIYEFSYHEDNIQKKVLARYTFVIKNNKIITHHSSVNPEFN